MHIDEKENFKKKINKMKEDIARQNREIQKQKNRGNRAKTHPIDEAKDQ